MLFYSGYDFGYAYAYAVSIVIMEGFTKKS